MSTEFKHALLLVDDEREILYSLKGLLRRKYELHTAESAGEALEILQRQSIHVIMTDHRMPGMSGSELLARIRTTCPDAIRIMFTGYADIRAVIDAVNNGGLFRYLVKPWDPDELIELLEEATVEYDRRVDTRQLLEELQQYLPQVCSFLSARGGATKGGATDDGQLAQDLIVSGEGLLRRLKSANTS